MKTNNLPLSNKIRIKNIKKNSFKKLNKEFNKAIVDINCEIKNPQTTLSILSKEYKFNFKINDLNKFKKFKTITFVGMGGSILGAEAIYNFFKTKVKKKVYFLNDIDEDKITNLKASKNLPKTLFVVISKSGNTTETLSNIFALNILKKRSKNIIIISEKKDNLLFSISKRLGIFYVEHKDYIGGRYSVLSEVGMLPAHLMGININKLRSDIRDCIKEKNKILLKNSTIQLANIISKKKFYSLILLNYSPELEKFLYWCQQLIAESLGKKNKGILPVVSNAPKDHHSLLQLYLDGPDDKFFNIFSYDKKSKEKVEINKSLSINSFLNKKKLSSIKSAQRKALIKSFLKKNISFREFKIKRADENVLGKLFSLFMIETIIVGKLLNINPFDQPAVEQVKVNTKQILI